LAEQIQAGAEGRAMTTTGRGGRKEEEEEREKRCMCVGEVVSTKHSGL
jgi:hypothetical protein